MSKRAEIMLVDGTWQPINIVEVHDKNKCGPFRCGWKSKDGTAHCKAPMSVANHSEDGSPWYFREAKRVDAKHIERCPYKRHQKESFVSRCDHTGEGHTKESFLERLILGRSSSAKKPKPELPPNEHGVVEDGDNGVAKMGIRPLKPRDKVPNTVLRMGKLLESLESEDVYMDQLVKDWIIDFNSLDHYLENGIPSEGYYFVLATLVNPQRVGIERAENEWILADCRYQKDADKNEHIFYRLELEEKVYARLKKFANGSRKYRCYVLICARWEREEGITNHYIAKNVTKRMVAFLPKSCVRDIDEFAGV